MKHWPSQLFPIIVLALLAGLTFWLQSAVDRSDERHDGKLRHDPDAIAENFVARRFDENGLLKYRLSAPYLVHFPDDDSSEITAPILISYRPNTPPVTVTADHAKLTAKGEIVYLRDNVRLSRAATDTRPELLARSPDLTVHPEAGIAFTNSLVEITQGASWIRGVGAHIDHNASTFVLQSQVKGQYTRPRATP
jgi:lipopolysaccharide export system protein LptC